MRSKANTETAVNKNRAGYTRQGPAASHQPTSSLHVQALDSPTSLGKPFPKSAPARGALQITSERNSSAPRARSGGSLPPAQSPRAEGAGTPLLGALSPPPAPQTPTLRAARCKQKRQLESHLPPPLESSCRESSRPEPRRRRRGCSDSGSAAWSAPQCRRPPSPAGPSWTKTRSSRGTRYEASWRLGCGDRCASGAEMVPRDPGVATPASLAPPDETWLSRLPGPPLCWEEPREGDASAGGRGHGCSQGKSEVSPAGSPGSRRLRLPESRSPLLVGRCC